MDTIKNLPWITAVKRKHTPLFLDFLIRGQSIKHISKNTGYNFSFNHILKSGLTLAYHKQEITENRLQIRRSIEKKGLEVFDLFNSLCLKSCESFLQFGMEQKGKDFTHFSMQELQSLFDKYSVYASNHAAFLQTMILTQFELEKLLDDSISTLLGENDPKKISDYKTRLSVTDKPTHEIENGKRILEIVSYIQENIEKYKSWINENPIEQLTSLQSGMTELKQIIEEYVSEFGWMGKMYYDGEKTTSLDVILRINNLLEKDCKNELSKVTNRTITLREDQSKAIAELNGDAEFKKLIEVVGQFRFLRTYRLDVFFIVHEDLSNLLKELSDRLTIEQNDLIYLTTEEINTLIKDRTKTSAMQQLIMSRRKTFSFLVENKKVEWFEHEILRQGTNSNEQAKSNILTGQMANKGTAEGPAFLVLYQEHMEKMSRGEILVTTMTMPSLMLAVEKSSGIITDEGGMLCHAAIVSRELDIPCLIGTQYATQVFKSGDIISLDASQEVATKIQGKR